MASVSSGTLRLLLADDHLMMRDGLRSILTEEGFEVVGEASDGREAVKLGQSLGADVAILDISMPLLNGIDAAREILKDSPRTKIIVLTMHTDDRYVLASLRAGIAGFVLKSKAASNLVQAIHAVCNGEVYLSSGASKAVVEAYLANDNTPDDQLSMRQREVLQLIAEGKNVKEIAIILGISAKTAESHRTSLMRKLHVHEVAGLVRYAVREGLVQDAPQV
jgi:two-component system, NarL family, response regulator NreC